jgi:REP element-mobilizing transposase RayT
MPSFPHSGRQALRRGRVSIPGQVYLLTATTHLRRRVFVDTVFARAVSRVIHSTSTWGNSQLLAWVLMPDHWHGLLQLGDEPLGRVMNRFNGGASRALHASGEMERSPWDRGFKIMRCVPMSKSGRSRVTSWPTRYAPGLPTTCLDTRIGMLSGWITTRRRCCCRSPLAGDALVLNFNDQRSEQEHRPQAGSYLFGRGLRDEGFVPDRDAGIGRSRVRFAETCLRQGGRGQPGAARDLPRARKP